MVDKKQLMTKYEDFNFGSEQYILYSIRRDMIKHQKLASRGRDKIAYWFVIGESIREIAGKLGRSHSSISDELKRNRVDSIYHSIQAHKAGI